MVDFSLEALSACVSQLGLTVRMELCLEPSRMAILKHLYSAVVPGPWLSRTQRISYFFSKIIHHVRP
jgi:hypothetical protein